MSFWIDNEAREPLEMDGLVKGSVKLYIEGDERSGDRSMSFQGISFDNPNDDDINFYVAKNENDFNNRSILEFEDTPSAERGCSISQGPEHTFHPLWLISLPGMEHVMFSLWLIKDWTWSQLCFPLLATSFALLAVISLSCMIGVAVYKKIFSEAYLSTCLLLWLLANCIWMTTEFYVLFYGDDSSNVDKIGAYFVRYMLLSSVILLFIFFAILVPVDVFATDRDLIPVRRMVFLSPPCPMKDYFKEWRIWLSLHLLAWATKDCFWAWNMPIAYGVAFCFTIALNIDQMWRLATHLHQYTSFVQSTVILLWVLANGNWALGELLFEVDLGENEDIFRQYSFIGPLVTEEFLPRRIAGWIFLFGACVLALFYIQWVAVSLRGSTPTYQDFLNKISARWLRNGHDTCLDCGLDTTT